MTDEYDNGHEHALEAEYLSASDATVTDISREGDGVVIDVVVPCPTCSEPLRASSRVRSVSEADIELPIEDVEDSYD